MSVFHAEEKSTHEIIRCYQDPEGIWVDDENDPGYIDDETFEKLYERVN